ncbi:hypothetical protein [uncultured Parasphingopyxis sp.]|uniref:hypothetical protein n=1 Tax=uncultured Parasphingopyxis sp. TaxID=1547918 RepID=UPI00262F16D1|nr:hypothetical protein [uncultured Parasphingopyxis sp.]
MSASDDETFDPVKHQGGVRFHSSLHPKLTLRQRKALNALPDVLVLVKIVDICGAWSEDRSNRAKLFAAYRALRSVFTREQIHLLENLTTDRLMSSKWKLEFRRRRWSELRAKRRREMNEERLILRAAAVSSYILTRLRANDDKERILNQIESEEIEFPSLRTGSGWTNLKSDVANTAYSLGRRIARDNGSLFAALSSDQCSELELKGLCDFTDDEIHQIAPYRSKG